MTSFGKEVRSQFLLNDDFVFLNHASYGAVCRRAHEAKMKKQEYFEANPDKWFRRMVSNEYRENVEAAAKFLGASPENTALVANATTGINAILRSLIFKPGDGILINTWTYGTIRTAVNWVGRHTGADIYMVDIPLPFKDKQQLIDAYRKEISKHNNIKLAVIDVISSVPAIYLPFREVSEMCQEAGILVLLDGAHAPGQIHVELEKWKPDFYVGNLHKWMYTPRGSAILYVRAEHQDKISPTVCSKCIFDKDLWNKFSYQGTDDITRLCVAKEALTFYEELGGLDAIGGYNTDLVTTAAEMLVKRWDTRMLDIPRDMEAPYMKMIRLPDIRGVNVTPWNKDDIMTYQGDMPELMYILMDRFHLITYCNYIQGEPYTRISANIYNVMEDYDKLADAILQLKQEAE